MLLEVDEAEVPEHLRQFFEPVKPSLKPLDWVDIPGMFARAMQAAGWLWRSDVTWVKPSALPESVQGTRWERCRVKRSEGDQSPGTGERKVSSVRDGQHGNRDVGSFESQEARAEWADCPGCPKCEKTDGLVLRRGSGRPTKATERVLLFAKRAGYFYDADAVRLYGNADTEAVREVQSRYGSASDQDLQAVRARQTADQVPPPTRTLVDGDVSGLRVGPPEGLASDGAGPGVVHGDERSLPADREAQGGHEGAERPAGCARQEEGLGAERGWSGGEEAVQPVGEAPRRPPSLLREWQGQGADQALSSDRQGQREPAPRVAQAPGQDIGADAVRGAADGRGVGGNQGGARQRLPLLWDDGATPDAGPRHPAGAGRAARQGERGAGVPELQQQEGRPATPAAGRNLVDYWIIGPEPLRDSHYAAYPSQLAARCIKAGTSERGCCPACGAGWARVVSSPSGGALGHSWHDHSADALRGNFKTVASDGYAAGATLGWRPTCACPPHTPVPCRVLDPFGGSGTTGVAADRLGRDAILIELKPAYAKLAERRLNRDAPLLMWGAVTVEGDLGAEAAG